MEESRSYFEKVIKDVIMNTTSPGPYDEEYKNLWWAKKRTFRYIDTEHPAVLFIDAKNTTKDHKTYPLDKYMEVLYNAALTVMQENKIDTLIYTGADEISIVILKPMQLVHVYQEQGQQEYITQLIIQDMMKNIWKVYPDNRIRGCLFSIDEEDIGKYILYRKRICSNIGLTWLAKENGLPSYMYTGKENKSIKKALDKSGIEIPKVFENGIVGKTEEGLHVQKDN